MKVLTKSTQKVLFNLVTANQIILNAMSSLEASEKSEASRKFCDNTISIIYLICGEDGVDELSEVIYNYDKH